MGCVGQLGIEFNNMKSLFVAFFFAASALAAQVPAASDVANLSDLPLNELAPRADSASGSASGMLVVFFTGDGGWAELDKGVSTELANHGAAVVGFNARAYIGKVHSPDRFAIDVERVIQHYMSAWNRRRVVLVGYSRGAELAPFAVTRLPVETRSHIELLALLGLSPGASFHFHFGDLFRNVVRADDLPTVPELEKLRGMKMLCIYGKDEDVSGCRSAPAGLMTVVERPGGHHFDDNYKLLGRIILSSVGASGLR